MTKQKTMKMTAIKAKVKRKKVTEDLKKMTTIRLSDSLRKKFHLISVATGKSLNHHIIEAANNYMETDEMKKILKNFNVE